MTGGARAAAQDPVLRGLKGALAHLAHLKARGVPPKRARHAAALAGGGEGSEPGRYLTGSGGADTLTGGIKAFEVNTSFSTTSDVEVFGGIASTTPLTLITDTSDAKAILRILEALEDNDDVQDVFSNFDMSDELMELAAP